jgi:hypothetical protein
MAEREEIYQKFCEELREFEYRIIARAQGVDTNVNEVKLQLVHMFLSILEKE